MEDLAREARERPTPRHPGRHRRGADEEPGPHGAHASSTARARRCPPATCPRGGAIRTRRSSPSRSEKSPKPVPVRVSVRGDEGLRDVPALVTARAGGLRRRCGCGRWAACCWTRSSPSTWRASPGARSPCAPGGAVVATAGSAAAAHGGARCSRWARPPRCGSSSAGPPRCEAERGVTRAPSSLLAGVGPGLRGAAGPAGVAPHHPAGGGAHRGRAAAWPRAPWTCR